jgi:hypothetical protein
MKKKLLTLLVLFCLGLTATAQIKVSTGLDLPLTGPEPVCNVDPYWKITGTTSPIVKITTPYFQFWEPTPVSGTNAQWINVTCNNSGETPGNYTFERDFTIAPGTSSFSCNFSVAVDDGLTSVELIPPTGPAILLPVSFPGSNYFLSFPITNTVSGPAPGTWKIRAKVVFIDQIAAFLLSGYVNVAQVVQDSTVYCCTGTNLFNNGNFEAGNVGFASSYTYQPIAAPNSVIPRQYNIVNSAQAAAISPQWFVEDHTKCINGTNAKFLVVNGRTMQAAGTNSVIWDETAPVTPNAEYKFCANVKNLAQCAFDIKPQIRIVITGGTWTTGSSAYQTINIPAGLCNWLQIGGCIKATGQQLRVQIFLLESGIGDGNDLALDDISLQKKLDQPSTLTVQHQGTPTQIIASINSIATSDDVLVTTGCGTQNAFTYQWFVYEVTAAAGFPMVPGTNAWSTNLAGYNNQTSLPVGPWALTTTFPGYNFAPNKLYLIGLSIPSCCNSCYADKWMYQITGFFGFTTPQTYNLTEEMKDYIRAMIKEQPVIVNPNDKSVFKVNPNPSNGIFQVAFDKQTSGTITITDSKGGKIAEKIISNEKTTDFNLSDSGSGIYFIKLNSGDKVYTEKMIKQ